MDSTISYNVSRMEQACANHLADSFFFDNEGMVCGLVFRAQVPEKGWKVLLTMEGEGENQYLCEPDKRSKVGKEFAENYVGLQVAYM